jgi:hypothetical protein
VFRFSCVDQCGAMKHRPPYFNITQLCGSTVIVSTVQVYSSRATQSKRRMRVVASVIGLALTGLLFEPSLAKGVAIGIDLGLFATLPSPTYACTTPPTVHPLSPSTRTPLHSLSLI